MMMKTKVIKGKKQANLRLYVWPSSQKKSDTYTSLLKDFFFFWLSQIPIAFLISEIPYP